MEMGGGEVIEGGGTVTYAYCRQKFAEREVLHGDTKAEDGVLEYGYVEKSDAFPGAREEKAIPSDARILLLLGKEGKIMKALPNTKENRDAVQSALARNKEKQKEKEDAQPGAPPDRSQPGALRPSARAR